MRGLFRRWWFSTTPPPLAEVVVFLVGFFPTHRWVTESLIDSESGPLPEWVPLASLLDVPSVLVIGLGAGVVVGAALTFGYRGARTVLQRHLSGEHRTPR